MAGGASAGDGGSAGDVKNSAVLLGDMEETKSKIEMYLSTMSRRNKRTPLNCWLEVRRFKQLSD